MNWSALQNGSDIRGIAIEGVEGEKVNLTPEVVGKIGFAFTQWLQNQLPDNKMQLKVAVGMDSRLSGPELKAALCKSLAASACEVGDCGLASTPAMFMSTIFDDFDYDGAIMLTASHLPFNRNGLKFFTKKGGLEKADIKAILELAAKEEQNCAPPGSITEIDLMSAYSGNFVQNIRTALNADNFLRF